MRSKLSLAISCCCLLFASTSCEDPNELGLELVDDNISGTYIDTLTVDVSTVYLDSVATSGTAAGTSNLLVGQYVTPYTGTTQANTLFQLGLGSTWTVEDNATFDSLKLILPYSGYSYGDTARAQVFEVYQLSNNISPRKLSPYLYNEEPYSSFYAADALYNVSRTGAKETPLASFTFQPRPNSSDTLKIPLAAELGQELLSLKKADDARLTEANNFIGYFKGLKLTSTQGASVLGFPAGAAKVRLYYTQTKDGAQVKAFHDFPLNNPALQYNQITADLTGTALSVVERGGAPVPAAETGNVSVAQAGTGLLIKLQFPHLDKLKDKLDPNFINKAVLVIEPVNGTTKYPYPVPTALALYRTDMTNVPLAQLTGDFDPTVQLTAAYVEGASASEKGRYVFGITQYIMERLQDNRETGAALFLAPLPAVYPQEVSRLVVGGPENPIQSIKLKVYYTEVK
ncbi:DUF4270 family protein [Pontibacter ummariensis]|uniref:DUF4270 family protein n=1 Tax=Pontibacter ummariensis TaxID=1610492 RepID=UPI0015C5BC04|nr:DUF4270 family protein [Pontibacter ummariensis]